MPHSYTLRSRSGGAIAKNTGKRKAKVVSAVQVSERPNLLEKTADGRTMIGGQFVNGRIRYTLENGTEVETQYKDGKRHGRHRFQTPSGHVLEGDYEDNKEHGFERSTHPNGHSVESLYQNGVKQGLEITRLGEGNGVMMFNYVDGKKQGRSIIWLNRDEDCLFYDRHEDDVEVASMRHFVAPGGRLVPGDGSLVPRKLAQPAEKRRRFDAAMERIETIKHKLSENEYLEMCNALKACHDLP
jgi:hypothetical protein